MHNAKVERLQKMFEERGEDKPMFIGRQHRILDIHCPPKLMKL